MKAIRTTISALMLRAKQNWTVCIKITYLTAECLGVIHRCSNKAPSSCAKQPP